MLFRSHRASSLHVPILALGHVDETYLDQILTSTQSVCADTDIFDLFFDIVTLFYKNPQDADDRRNAQRVILRGEHSDALKTLHENLSKSLDLFVAQKKVFRPQVTLGKIRAHRWHALAPPPDIEHAVNVSLDVATITLFENSVIDGQREFTALDAFALS